MAQWHRRISCWDGYGVGDLCAAAERLEHARCCVLDGVVLHFGVQRGRKQHDCRRDLDPSHEFDHGLKRTEEQASHAINLLEESLAELAVAAEALLASSRESP
jgi:hypothetical protein